MATKTKNQLEQENERLKKALEAQRYMEYELKDQRRSKKVVRASKYRSELQSGERLRLMLECKWELLGALEYANKDVRLASSVAYSGVVGTLKYALEHWVKIHTGDSWRVKDITIAEGYVKGAKEHRPKPLEDHISITWTHLGIVEKPLGHDPTKTQRVNQQPEPVYVKTTVFRHELSQI